jgi:hypothetical protein
MKGKNPVTIFIVLIILGVLGMAVVVTADVIRNLRPATETLPADTPTVGIGRDAESADVGIWLASVCADDVPSLAEYTEGDGPAPEWYRPDEPMSAEWEDSNARQSDSNAIQRTDAGCPDWNLDSTLYGWDGHGAEAWELDLLARVFYLEFWGTSLPCSEAGCDAILNLWASGKYGRTLFEALSYYDPVYGYTYEVYPWIWNWNYDADGLAWCRELCEERFYNGPEWCAQYFRLGGYHDPEWVTPAYEIDGVYFSVAGVQ